MKKNHPDQTAIGSNIVQAINGSTATLINFNQKTPLRSVLAVAPPPPEKFTGRDELIKEIRDLLMGSSTGIVIAMSGMGGIGKTATIKKIASELIHRFPGGIFWASLPETNGDSLPILHAWAIMCAYEMPESVDAEVASSIIRGLFTQRIRDLGPILIVIDDLRKEWMDDTRILRKAIAENTPVLITTRDEHLALELDAMVFRLDALTINDAKHLLKKFIGTIVDESKDSDELLELVGYLPLAIEIAGKKLIRLLQKPGYSIHALKTEIESKASKALVLSGHFGIASCFTSTYDELDSLTKLVFRYLGCFTTGFIFVEDVHKIVGTKYKVSLNKVGKMLDDLEQYSLLNWGGFENSYVMHPLLRQFAQDLLIKDGEIEQATQGHIQLYCNFFEEKNFGPDLAFPIIETRLPNFLLAAENAYKNNNIENFIHISMMLARTDGYLYLKGYWDQATMLLRQGYVSSVKIGDESLVKQFMWQLATISREKGLYIDAKKIFIDLVAKERSSGTITSNLARSLFGLGYVHLYLSEYDDAEHLLQEACNVSHLVNDDYSLGESLRGLGRVCFAQNKIQDSVVFFEKSIPILERSHNVQGLIYALRGWGEILNLQKEYQKSMELLSRSLELAEQVQDKQAIGYILRALGNLYVSQMEYHKAKEIYIRCADICNSIGETGSLAATQSLLGDVLFSLKEYSAAEIVFIQGKELASMLGLKRWGARADFGLAKIYFEKGEKKKALDYAGKSLKVLDEIKHRDSREVQIWLKDRHPT